MKRKSERVIFLAEPSFKRLLQAQAKREAISVAELVRSRFQKQPSEEEAMLAALTEELNRRVDAAEASVDRALKNIDAVLAELRQHREQRAAARAEAGRSAAMGSEPATSGKPRRIAAAGRA